MNNTSAKTNGNLHPGVSKRFGPSDEDVDMNDDEDVPLASAAASKRRARVSAGGKSYAEAVSSEDDEKPLVCFVSQAHRLNCKFTTFSKPIANVHQEQTTPNIHQEGGLGLGG